MFEPKTTLPERLLHWLGIEPDATSHLEKWVSVLGGLAGIALVSVASALALGPGPLATLAVVLVAASMGSSAVLLFALPHSASSQPWPVFGGHLVSALVGVACTRWFGAGALGAGAAVGLAIGAMHYLRCIHPPGGATALTAVVGGPVVHGLGYQFVVTPILVNVVLLLLAAVAVNALFPWRRYPAAWGAPGRAVAGEAGAEAGLAELSPADLEYAMKRLDLVIDVAPEDLRELYTVAAAHAQHGPLAPEAIRLGGCYSNGRFDAAWQVRQVIDLSPDGRWVVYQVLAGAERRQTGTALREDFARWARYPVAREGYYWRRLPLERPAGGPQILDDTPSRS